MGRRGPMAASSIRSTQGHAAGFSWLSSTGRGLAPAEKEEWNRTVKAKDPGFYIEDDAGLLKQLCQAVVDRDELRRQVIEAREAGDNKEAILLQAQWRQQASLISNLSRQLKIGASARETHRAAAKAARVGLPEVGGSISRYLWRPPDKDPADDLN